MPFLQAFQRLLLEKPRYALKGVGSENCDYADVAVRSKNCYYCFGIFYSEDVSYARYSRKCVSCNGLTFCLSCEWCLECVDCAHCYNCDWCQDCGNCRDSRFCVDCFGCSNCFGCVGLYQKQYRMFNEQLTKEEYEKRMQALNLKNHVHREAVRARVQELRKKTPNLAVHQFSCEDCVGNHLTECKNCYRCHDSFAMEDCFYCIETNGNKDCADLTICFEDEGCYQCVHCPLCYRCTYCYHCDYCQESEFCAFSKNLKNCFGCVYLQNKQYMILNQGPYPPEEYAMRVAAVRQELQAQGQYNLLPYLFTDYERHRLATETDPVIQALPPSPLEA